MVSFKELIANRLRGRSMDATHHRKLYEAMAGGSIGDNSFDYTKSQETWILPREDGEVNETNEHDDENEIEIPLGGMIIFSTDLTPTMLQGQTKSIQSKIYQFLINAAKTLGAKGPTFKNRFERVDNVDAVMKRIASTHNQDLGYSIGNMYDGRYFDQGQQLRFDERSMTLDVFGVDSIVLKDIAKSIGKMFDQKCVLVHDRVNYERGQGRSYLLNT